MTDSTLKSVVVLDPESQAYRPSAHNLSASEAGNLAEQFSNENRTAKVLDQKDRHLVSDPAKCRACKKAAEAASQTPNPDAVTADAVHS
jgi:predicted Zn-ribbon and HTH transcriptional regulator